jgi:predicted permease
MDELVSNVKLGLRLLRKQPGFSAIAVGVLALGIGANSAMFSLVNTLLFRPVGVAEPSTLVGVFSRNVKSPDSYRAFSYAEYSLVRERNTAFRDLLAYDVALAGVEEGATTRRVLAELVSANFFATLGVPIARGRAFSSAEESPGSAAPVAIVSDSYWQRLGAPADMLGRSLRLDGRDFTVVGIAPRGFTSTTAMISPEIYLPLGDHDLVADDLAGVPQPLADSRTRRLILIGRLRPGLTRAAVDNQLAATAAGLPSDGPEDRQTLIARPLSRISISTSPQSDEGLRTPSLLLLFLSGVVLLIASFNIANMMVVRGQARRREIAIRLALGARRRSILVQLFTEGLLLALLGGVAGLAVAAWSTSALARSLATLAPVDVVVSALPDARVLGATAGFCLLSTLFFALGPAWDVSRPSVVADLKRGEPGVVRGRIRRLFARRSLLAIGQLGLSLMLLTTAGLFVRSSLRAAQLTPGFALADQVLIEVAPGLAGYDAERGRAVVDRLVEHYRALPGVRAASMAATVPFGMISLGRDVQRASDPAPQPGARPVGAVNARYNVVSDGYFETLAIPLLRGRALQAADRAGAAPAVAVIDRLMAERLWPHGDAVGQSIRMDGEAWMRSRGVNGQQVVQVVGVVDNVQESMLGEALQPHVYLPYGPAYQSDVTLHVRLTGGGAAAEARLVADARREVAAVDDHLPVIAARSLRQHLDASFDVWVMRIAARMIALFGIVAVLLAAIGLYGVRAFAVARRTREIGVRMALGASAGDAARMMLREGMQLSTVGLAFGLVLSVALGRVLGSLLYRVSGTDPLVLALATALLLIASLLACWMPARRAAQVPPMASLRAE